MKYKNYSYLQFLEHLLSAIFENIPLNPSNNQVVISSLLCYSWWIDEEMEA